MTASAKTPDERRERAEEAVKAVNAGANPGEEALTLANEYSDELTDRAKAFIGRLLRRR
ncbi:hypothetical protein HD599_002657 [Conyzicola lurida]|uniref:Uncharacterized protein n=1 Tax=Conyzicola lurida TaxID=1172621 RepID=A0A841APW7_9MICO|nr:hypothetical protein [Conyzicola lurida]MBB5844334.1 hypothetical protein [Conyzicola lurida]